MGFGHDQSSTAKRNGKADGRPWSKGDRRWHFVGSALSAYLDKRNDSAKSLALAVILFAGLQIWNIAPWILVVIGAVIGGIFL